MKAALLLFMFCLAEADDVRYEIDARFKQLQSSLEERMSHLERQLKSHLEGQDAELEDKLQKNCSVQYSEWMQDKLVNDLDQLTDQKNQLQSRYDDLVGQKNQLQSQYDDLAGQKNQLQSQYDDLAGQKNQLQSQYDSVTAERDGLKRRLCESYGFTLDGSGVCYYISTEAKSWEQSREYCRVRQSDLIIMNSKDKQDLVHRVGRGHGVWIGLTDREEEGVWKWVDRTPLTSPTFWFPGEPNNRENEDCVDYYNVGSHIGWYDYPCSRDLRWMCERVV